MHRITRTSITMLAAAGIFFTCGAPVALAQDSQAATPSYQGQVNQTYRDSLLSTVWKSGANGALVGLGAGASVSLIGFSLGADTEPVRVVSGLTGAGFIAGALWGFVEHTYWSDDIAAHQPGLRIRPEVLAQQDKAGPGLQASFRF